MPRGLSLIDPLIVPPTKPVAGVPPPPAGAGKAVEGGVSGISFLPGVVLLERGAHLVPVFLLSLPVSGSRMAG